MTASFRAQIDSFLEGFHECVPAEAVSVFDAHDLELLISGTYIMFLACHMLMCIYLLKPISYTLILITLTIYMCTYIPHILMYRSARHRHRGSQMQHTIYRLGL